MSQIEKQLHCPVERDGFEVRAVLSPIADDRGYLQILSLVDDLGGYPGAGFYRISSSDPEDEDMACWIHNHDVNKCPPSRVEVIQELVEQLPLKILKRFGRFCSGIASKFAWTASRTAKRLATSDAASLAAIAARDAARAASYAAQKSAWDQMFTELARLLAKYHVVKALNV